MWKEENLAQFEAIIADILEDPDVQAMQDQRQHSKHSNTLDHSLHVAYMSFLACRRLGLDYEAAARAGLLHDFALCDWEQAPKKERRRRLWLHPHYALENASQKYELSEKEQDIIVKHMWPLTRPLPRHKESLVVSMMDKLCAVMEMSRLHRALKVQKKLRLSRRVPVLAA